MATSDLRSIPGVGPTIARELEEIGVHAVADLAGRDPEELYPRWTGGFPARRGFFVFEHDFPFWEQNNGRNFA